MSLKKASALALSASLLFSGCGGRLSTGDVNLSPDHSQDRKCGYLTVTDNNSSSARTVLEAIISKTRSQRFIDHDTTTNINKLPYWESVKVAAGSREAVSALLDGTFSNLVLGNAGNTAEVTAQFSQRGVSMGDARAFLYNYYCENIKSH